MSTPIPTAGTKIYIRTVAGLDKEIGTHKSIGGFDGERAELDRTTLADFAEVVALSPVQKFGTVTLNCMHSEDDEGMIELEVASDDAEKRLITWVFSTGAYRQFSAYVKSFPFSDGAIDADWEGSIPLRVTGKPSKGTDFVPVTS